VRQAILFDRCRTPARDPDDFGGTYRKIDVAQRDAEGIARGHRKVAQFEPNFAGLARLQRRPRTDRRPTMRRARLAFDSSRGRAVPLTFPARNTVALSQRGANLLELVADVQNAHAFGSEAPQGVEQLLHSRPAA